jgi:hypothetical protein
MGPRQLRRGDDEMSFEEWQDAGLQWGRDNCVAEIGTRLKAAPLFSFWSAFRTPAASGAPAPWFFELSKLRRFMRRRRADPR